MICFRLLDTKDPAQPLADAVRALANEEASQDTYEVEPTSFRHIPNAPFAYWVSESIRELFVTLPAFESEERTAKQGLATADDFRFVRSAWETPVNQGEIEDRTWFHFAKGGSYSPFYADVFLKVNWRYGGNECKNYIISRYPYLNGNAGFVAKNTDYYFQPGLTWPRRTQSGLALRAMPKGCVFADKGPALFHLSQSNDALPHYLALTSSTPFKALVELQMAFGSYEVGVIQRTVIPVKDDPRLPELATHAWQSKRKPDTANLTSHAFIAPALAPKSKHI